MTAHDIARTPLPARTPSRSRRYPAVDGLRGVAILSVLFYHAGITGRGLFGVDVFFTISGFFVTLLLMRELSRSGRMDLSGFYARRARRILPGVLLVLALTIVLVARYGDTGQLERGARTAIAAVLQVANWQQVLSGGAYWDHDAGVDPFGQLWSLSVTEQFYLVWPLLLLALWTVCHGRGPWILVCLGVLTAASALVAPALFDGTNADRLYMGTDARAVAFVAGGLAGAAVELVERGRRSAEEPRPGRRRPLLAAASALLLAVLVGTSVLVDSYYQPWLYRGGFAGIALVTAALVATLCVPGNALARVFENRVLAAIGRLAYLLFLLHLPVYWLLQRHRPDLFDDGWILFAIGAPVTLLAAMLMHGLFAEPLRTRAWSRAGGIGVAVLASAVVCTVALAMPPIPAPHTAISHADQVTGPVQTPEEFAAEAAGYETLVPRADGTRPRVVVLGDSVGNDFARALQDGAADQVDVTDLAWGGCGLFDPETAGDPQGWMQDPEVATTICASWHDKLVTELEKGDVDLVLVHAAWDGLPQKIDGTWISPCDPAWQDRYETKLEDLLATVGTLSPATRVLISDDRTDPGTDTTRARCFNSTVLDAADSHGARVLPWADYVCPPAAGRCRTVNPDGTPTFRDSTHLSDATTPYIAPWLIHHLATAQRSG